MKKRLPMSTTLKKKKNFCIKLHREEKLATNNCHSESRAKKKKVWQRTFNSKGQFSTEGNVSICDVGVASTTREDEDVKTLRAEEHKRGVNTKVFTIHLYKYLTRIALTMWIQQGRRCELWDFFFTFFLVVWKTRQNLWNGNVYVATSLSVTPGRLFGTLRDPEGVAFEGAVEHFGKRAAWAAAWGAWRTRGGVGWL